MTVEPNKQANDALLAETHPLDILVVEDNIVNHQVIKMILSHLGYYPAIVKNGKEAILAVTEKRYDLVLMDIRMPIMDGIEATQRIKGMEEIHIPRIVALTAHAFANDRQKYLNAGMDGYLTKPLRIESLITELRQCYRMSVNDIRPLPSTVDSIALANQFGEDTTEMFHRLIPLYLQESAEQINLLTKAIDTDDMARVGFLTHRMKGSSAVMGLVELTQLFSEISQEAKAGNINICNDKMVCVKQQLADLRDWHET